MTTKAIKSIPRGGLPAQVKATIAYFGMASGCRIDKSLDDEPEIEVVVMARSVEELSRFFDHVQSKFDPSKTQRVALVSQDAVVLNTPAASIEDEEL